MLERIRSIPRIFYHYWDKQLAIEELLHANVGVLNMNQQSKWIFCVIRLSI